MVFQRFLTCQKEKKYFNSIYEDIDIDYIYQTAFHYSIMSYDFIINIIIIIIKGL